MILYLKKDKKAEEVQHGDRLVFNVRAQTIQPPKNPEEFNYKRYLGIKKFIYKDMQQRMFGKK